MSRRWQLEAFGDDADELRHSSIGARGGSAAPDRRAPPRGGSLRLGDLGAHPRVRSAQIDESGAAARGVPSSTPSGPVRTAASELEFRERAPI
jgi:hypothetical protein